MSKSSKRSARQIGENAFLALCLEAGAAPKPGLVDRENSGAHKDMDYALFLKSARSLQPFFEECARIGIFAGRTARAAGMLKKSGLAAEQDMMVATGGVNTHKGAIFSMGILCCSLGSLETERKRENYGKLREDALRHGCGELAALLLADVSLTEVNSHGSQVFLQTGTGGVRKEALSGFGTAFSVGFPALRKALREGCSLNQAMVETLLRLMTVTEDSNAVYRGGTLGLRYLQREAGRLLSANLRTKKGLELVRNFDRTCVEKNLSPGGSADLLAFSVMLHLSL